MISTGTDEVSEGSSRRPDKITIRDVARHAGVSYQTVSRAINDGYGISPSTKDHVLASAAALGFVPSSLARGLATNRTRTIGLAVPTLVNPFFAELAQSMIDAAAEVGHTVIVISSPLTPDGEHATLETLSARALDSVVGFFERTTAKELARYSQNVPLVLINREVRGIDGVEVDAEQGMTLLVEHLAALGHTTVALLDGSPEWATDDVRRLTFMREARRLGWPVSETLAPRSTNDSTGGRETATRLIANHPDVTAVVAYNDAMALGAMAVLSEHGIRVPEQISIVGFDGIDIAHMITPILTTVATDFTAMGQHAVAAALRAGGDSRSTTVPHHVRLPMVLSQGNSSTHR